MRRRCSSAVGTNEDFRAAKPISHPFDSQANHRRTKAACRRRTGKSSLRRSHIAIRPPQGPKKRTIVISVKENCSWQCGRELIVISVEEPGLHPGGIGPGELGFSLWEI